MAAKDYEQLLAGQPAPKAGGAAFLEWVEALKQRHGGGADFAPRRLDIVPADPFARRPERR